MIMDKPYFIMLMHPNRQLFMPLVDESGEVFQFESRDEAENAAYSSSLGSGVGYEVFCFEDL